MGDFLLCKFNRIWGERVTGDGDQGGEEEAVEKCKGAKVERWRGLFGYEGAVGGLAPEAVNVDEVFANSCDGNF